MWAAPCSASHAAPTPLPDLIVPGQRHRAPTPHSLPFHAFPATTIPPLIPASAESTTVAVTV